MHLFTKKSASDGDASAYAAWHPDFRDVRGLPDTKTIRTTFFVNACAILIAICAALYLLQKEYTLSSLRTQLGTVEQEVASTTKSSRDAVALFAKYKVEEAKIQELMALLSREKILISDFTYEVGQTLPEYVTVTLLSFKDTGIVIKGVIKAPEQASTIASAFERQLKESSTYSDRFASVTMTALSRDAVTGLFNLEMSLKYKN